MELNYKQNECVCLCSIFADWIYLHDFIFGSVLAFAQQPKHADSDWNFHIATLDSTVQHMCDCGRSLIFIGVATACITHGMTHGTFRDTTIVCANCVKLTDRNNNKLNWPNWNMSCGNVHQSTKPIFPFRYFTDMRTFLCSTFLRNVLVSLDYYVYYYRSLVSFTICTISHIYIIVTE